MDNMINRLRLKYMTYTMDFEVDCVSILLFQYFLSVWIFWICFNVSNNDVVIGFMQGVVIIPNSFGSDFGDEIDRYVVFVDKNNNEFEVRVERINGSIFFTRGWVALRDFGDFQNYIPPHCMINVVLYYYMTYLSTIIYMFITFSYMTREISYATQMLWNDLVSAGKLISYKFM